jgi:TolB-like protein
MHNRHAWIAILPFENLSGTADDARLAVGFVQDLITELARFSRVGCDRGGIYFRGRVRGSR